MKSVAFFIAVLASIASVGGIAFLIMTVSADADPIKALIGCVVFFGGSILAASNWVKAFNIKITPETKIAK